MSKHEKLINKLKSRTVNFTYSELKKLLHGFNYYEIKAGKTSGSRVAFIHSETKHIIRLHKPHPNDNLKLYQIDLIISELTERGLLE